MFKNSWKRLIGLMMVLVMALGMSSMAFATDQVSSIDESQSDAAYRQLFNDAFTATSDNTYERSDGGSYSGSEIWGQAGSELNMENYSSSKLLVPDESKYEELTQKEKSRFVDDFLKAVNDQAKANEQAAKENNGNWTSGAYNGKTVASWLKSVQKTSVGTELMQDVLAGTKPDFASAKKLYDPFSGVVGTVMGILAILIISLLGLVMVLDIAYIVLPPFRMLVGDGKSGGEGKNIGSALISHNAIKAVEVAESEEKQALGIYFKKQVVALIILGICLLYLINGQIYTLVGYILNLVSGFLGF